VVSPFGPTETGEGRSHSPSSSSTPTGHPPTPPTIRSAVPDWEIGDQIPLVPARPPLLVVGLRNASEPEHHALLVVSTGR